LDAVRRAVEQAGADILNAEVAMLPKTQIDLPVDQTGAILRLVERLEDLDDVSRVYTNVRITDEALAQAAS
jgi:transcriptional/translational regulatory protein YebC/TACO1